MKPACIVHAHHAGLFSLINNVVTCMLEYEQVKVQWREGCIYGESKVPFDTTGLIRINVWDELFEPLPFYGRRGERVIRGYEDQWLTYKNAAKLYVAKVGDLYANWRKHCNGAWQRITVQKDIQAKVDVMMDELRLSDFISVLVRSTPHAGEQISGVTQSLDRYAMAIERAIGPKEAVYVLARDMDTLDWLSARFPVVYSTKTKRSQSRDVDLHLAEPQTIEDARQCLVDVMVASHARALIHPVSNMSTAALYMNPELQSIYLP